MIKQNLYVLSRNTITNNYLPKCTMCKINIELTSLDLKFL